MKVKCIMGFCASLAIGAFFVSGCASNPEKELMKGPDWVWKGSGAFDTEKGKVFRAVESVSIKNIKNKALYLAVAKNRARIEFRSIADRFVALLVNDYFASTTAGNISYPSEEPHIEQELWYLASSTAKITDYWTDQADRTMFALCELDLFVFKNALDDYSNLNEEVRDHIKKNIGKIYSQFKEWEELPIDSSCRQCRNYKRGPRIWINLIATDNRGFPLYENEIVKIEGIHFGPKSKNVLPNRGTLEDLLAAGMVRVISKRSGDLVNRIYMRSWTEGYPSKLAGCGGRLFALPNGIIFLKSREWIS